ncbi:MAG TPA: hypothetical protein VG676_13575 [Chitinophagaceae bacterium]|jgi:hypothetical protein|nr:hypothetical protein [Chitinophagaceae bacterium]
MAQNETKVSARLKEVNNDTVAYVRNYMIARKNSYIGKPLDSLLKDLPMPAKRYINTVSDKPYVYPSTYIFLYTKEGVRIAQKKDPLDIVITWQTPISRNELINAGIQSLSGEWTQAVYNFFKNRIIKNISLVKYDF